MTFLRPYGVSLANVAEPVLDLAGRVAGLDVATIVIACVFAFLFALHRRWIVLGREFEERDQTSEDSVEALRLAYEERIATMLESHRLMFETVRQDRDLWRDTAIRALDLGERVVASKGGSGSES